MLELITQKDQDFLQNIENLDEEYIQKFINKKISEIAIAIETAAENADKAKDRTQKAKNLNTDSDWQTYIPIFGRWLGETSEEKKEIKSNMILEVAELQNESMNQMTTILKEVVIFFTSSFCIATRMNQALSLIIAQGFVKSDGKVIRLSKAAKEQFQQIQKFTLSFIAVSFTHSRPHETSPDNVCRLLLEKKKHKRKRVPCPLLSDSVDQSQQP
ncbi:hypothetical protein ACISOM_06840 [Campylobacter jejuni]